MPLYVIAEPTQDEACVPCVRPGARLTGKSRGKGVRGNRAGERRECRGCVALRGQESHRGLGVPLVLEGFLVALPSLFIFFL